MDNPEIPEDDDESIDWAPERLPDWLVDQVRKSKGRNLSDFRGIEEFYKETEVVEADRFDTKNYKSMRNESEALRDAADVRFDSDPTWGELIQDEYLGLYKPEPGFRQEQDMKPTHKINWVTMNTARTLKDWEDLRRYTQVDRWQAAAASAEFAEKLGELFDELKELEQSQKAAQTLDEQIEQLLKDLEEAGEGGQIEDAEDLLDQLAEAGQAYAEAGQDIDDQLKGCQPQIRGKIREAAKEAKEEAENIDEMLTAFGTDPGQLTRMPAEARIELARRIQNKKKLRELAEKVGRFVRLALAEQARKIIHGTDEVHDVILGNDLGRVLASEIAELSHPVLKRNFYRRYSESELFQYELRGTEKVARGAIICMIDSSGSMTGSRETWAKAVGIALLNIAHKQKRDFVGMIFGSANELKEWHFPKGSGPPNDVLDFAEFEYQGGTDFQTPITRAIEVLQKQYNDDRAMKGDLVLITDGECAVSDEWRDRYFNAKNELAFRFYSCLIGVRSGTLDVLSDQIYPISELAKGDDAREIFNYV